MNETERIDSTEKAMAIIQDGYLDLIRENFLLNDDEENDPVPKKIASLTECILKAGNSELILQLMKSSNWRESVVGIFCAICAKDRLDKESNDHLHEELRLMTKRIRPLVTRAACLALTLWNDPAPIRELLAPDSFRADFLEEYAAAIGSVEQLDGLTSAHMESSFSKIMEAMRNDTAFDQQSFDESKGRFLRAVCYWVSISEQNEPGSKRIGEDKSIVTEFEQQNINSKQPKVDNGPEHSDFAASGQIRFSISFEGFDASESQGYADELEEYIKEYVYQSFTRSATSKKASPVVSRLSHPQALGDAVTTIEIAVPVVKAVVVVAMAVISWLRVERLKKQINKQNEIIGRIKRQSQTTNKELSVQLREATDIKVKLEDQSEKLEKQAHELASRLQDEKIVRRSIEEENLEIRNELDRLKANLQSVALKRGGKVVVSGPIDKELYEELPKRFDSKKPQ